MYVYKVHSQCIAPPPLGLMGAVGGSHSKRPENGFILKGGSCCTKNSKSWHCIFIARNPNQSRFRSHVWGCEGKCNHHGSHREVPQEIYRKWNISETNKSIWGILFPLGAATQGQVNQILATRQQTNTKCVDI